MFAFLSVPWHPFSKEKSSNSSIPHWWGDQRFVSCLLSNLRLSYGRWKEMLKRVIINRYGVRVSSATEKISALFSCCHFNLWHSVELLIFSAIKSQLLLSMFPKTFPWRKNKHKHPVIYQQQRKHFQARLCTPGWKSTCLHQHIMVWQRQSGIQKIKQREVFPFH